MGKKPTPEARFRRAILSWFRHHPRSFPWREQEDPYAVLIGEILLQRTRGEHTVDVYDEFLRRWPDPEHLSRARQPSIESVIRPLGLKKRAAIIKRLGQQLAMVRGVPAEPEALLPLAGVGPYAAHAVPIFARNRNLPLVDWVIARVLRRYFGLPSDRRPNADPELWSLAEGLVAAGRARELWLGTLDFAAAICRPRPLCEECPLNGSCAFYRDHAVSAS